MIFHCLQPRNKCEWSDLRLFVDSYNEANSTAYERERCLDVGNSSGKEPEVLLVAPGETPLVIERKSVVWPPLFGNDQGSEHHFGDLILKGLNSSEGLFTGSSYKLVINENSIKGKTKREVSEFAVQINRAILSNVLSAKTQRGIRSEKPIRWRFGKMSPDELDHGDPTSGICVIFESDWDFGDDLAKVTQEVKLAKAGYSEVFTDVVNDASAKFAKYEHCKKLLLETGPKSPGWGEGFRQ